MELLIILILILLGIILPIKIFKPTLILLAGLAAIPELGAITLPYIATISGDTITYSTLDPMTQWALALILIVTAIILYIEQIDTNNKNKEQNE